MSNLSCEFCIVKFDFGAIQSEAELSVGKIVSQVVSPIAAQSSDADAATAAPTQTLASFF
jgi:hypothetical protein